MALAISDGSTSAARLSPTVGSSVNSSALVLAHSCWRNDDITSCRVRAMTIERAAASCVVASTTSVMLATRGELRKGEK